MSSSQARRSAARFFESSISSHRKRFAGLFHFQAHQPAGGGRHGRLAQLPSAHFAQPLEAGHGNLACGGTAQQSVALGVGERVVRFLADVETVERRHHHVDVALSDQFRKVAREQGADQGGDMSAIGVGIRENAHLAIAQVAQIGIRRGYAQRHADVMDLLRGAQVGGIDFPGVENLAPQRQHGLVLAMPGLARRTARRIALHEEYLAFVGHGAGAIGQFAGQRRSGHRSAPRNLARGLDAPLSGVNGQPCNALAYLRVLVQPKRQGALGRLGRERGALARGQRLLHLPAELRFGQLHRHHEIHSVPNVGRRYFQVARQQLVELAEFPQAFGQAAAQTTDVRAVARRGHQVDVTLLHLVGAAGGPGHHAIQGLTFLILLGNSQRAVRQAFDISQLLGQVVAEPIFVVPFLVDALGFSGKRHGQARTQQRLGAQQPPERRQVKPGAREILRIGPKPQPGSGGASGHIARRCQRFADLAAGEAHAPLASITPHAHIETAGQGV